MILDVQHIAKSFDNEQVIRDLSFTVKRRETLSILGRSGCGKTTLLKIVAGIHKPDDGHISLNGKNILHLQPNKRNIVYLYQDALLFPHLSVFENIAFGLRLRKLEEQEIRHRTLNMIENLELHGKEDNMPHQLSGGQKQRVSFGRALIIIDESNTGVTNEINFWNSLKTSS